MEKFNHHSFFKKLSQEKKKCIYNFFNKTEEINETSVIELPKEIIDTIFQFFTAKEFIKTFNSISKGSNSLINDIIKDIPSLANEKALFKMKQQIIHDAQVIRLKLERVLAWGIKGEYYGKVSRIPLGVACLVNGYFVLKLADEFQNIPQNQRFGMRANIIICSLGLLITLLFIGPKLGKDLGGLIAMIKNYFEEDKNLLTTKLKLN